MKDAILAHFKAKFPDVNLSQKRLDALADKLSPKITDEGEIDAKLDDLNDVLPFADIARSDDKIRDLNSKLKAPKEAPKDQSHTQQPTDNNSDDMPAWAKPLFDKLQAYETRDKQQAMQQKIAQHEKLKGIPQTFLKGRALPDSDDAIESFVDSVSADFQAFTKEYQPAAVSTKPVIGNLGSAGANKVDPEVQAYIDSKKAKQVDKT